MHLMCGHGWEDRSGQGSTGKDTFWVCIACGIRLPGQWELRAHTLALHVGGVDGGQAPRGQVANPGAQATGGARAGEEPGKAVPVKSEGAGRQPVRPRVREAEGGDPDPDPEDSTDSEEGDGAGGPPRASGRDRRHPTAESQGSRVGWRLRIRLCLFKGSVNFIRRRRLVTTARDPGHSSSRGFC
jgi:hypothetical protein